MKRRLDRKCYASASGHRGGAFPRTRSNATPERDAVTRDSVTATPWAPFNSNRRAVNAVSFKTWLHQLGSLLPAFATLIASRGHETSVTLEIAYHHDLDRNLASAALYRNRIPK